MRQNGVIWRPDLSKAEVRRSLPVRGHPYWMLLSYGRHLGFHKSPMGQFWTARVRTKDGTYSRVRLGLAAVGDRISKTRLTYSQAIEAARGWFQEDRTKD